MKTFTQLKKLYTDWTQNETTENINTAVSSINDQHRYLLEHYFENEYSVIIPSVGQQQEYILPADVSKIINVTYTQSSGGVGVNGVRFPLSPVLDRNYWDRINTIPYYSDIPQLYYIYQGRINFFPTPATSNNQININYKRRTTQLNIDDYTTGQISNLTTGSITVNGTNTLWQNKFPTNRNIGYLNLFLIPQDGYGNDLEYSYKIKIINTNGGVQQITLETPIINGLGMTSAELFNYRIGQVPLVHEDFQELLVYRAVLLYYSTKVIDGERYKQFKDLENEAMKSLNDYASTKQEVVNLNDENTGIFNPNLYLRNIG